MELRFAHLADYAAADASGKLTIVGVFDIVWDGLGKRPIPFPPFYLVAQLEASIAEGAEHTVEIRLVDDDERSVGGALSGTVHFRASGVGHPARGHLLLGFGPGFISAPELGDYHFRFFVDGHDIGALRVSVLAMPRRA